MSRKYECSLCFNQPNITRLTKSFQPNKSTQYHLIPHYCNNCIRDILPFQSISDIEFEQLMVVSNLIPKLLNSENISDSNLLRLNTQTECKYTLQTKMGSDNPKNLGNKLGRLVETPNLFNWVYLTQFMYPKLLTTTQKTKVN